MVRTWSETKNRLDALNIKKGNFKTDNEYGIPIIRKQEEDAVQRLIPFGKSYRNGTAHFFLEDYAFERVWNYPKRYLPLLKEYDSVLSPDFSIYPSYPRVMQLWNLYRNRWCGVFWQINRVKVVPTVTWSDEKSLEFAFMGVEKGCTVAISTVGIGFSDYYKEIFEKGYDLMLKQLKPERVLVYSNYDLELDGEVQYFEGFAKQRFHTGAYLDG